MEGEEWPERPERAGEYVRLVMMPPELSPERVAPRGSAPLGAHRERSERQEMQRFIANIDLFAESP